VAARDDDEGPRPLSIGGIVGGPDLTASRWDDEVTRLSRVVSDLRPAAAEFNVSVVCHVPGSIVQPGYSGVRTGTYSRKRQELMVQAPVPAMDAEPGLMRTVIFGLLVPG
jgi:hypothetical protein